jgi:DNA (cytosine-5)-methyltransferase 1
MNHGSLFSGIGGFDLAAEWMGWNNIFHCEWNDFGQRVLKHHFPNSISYGDITTTDFTIHRGQIDILTGGFPCQPYSQAGKRLGKEDDRHLWPEMLRAIREIQPRWVVGENVLGLVNWNGGLVFDEVQADLENEGYVVQPYVLPACAVNAPHRRDRVWFVAYFDHTRAVNAMRDNGNGSENDKGRQVQPQSESWTACGDASHPANTRVKSSRRTGQDKVFGLESTSYANSAGFQEAWPKQQTTRIEQYGELGKIIGWDEFPTKSAVCGSHDGIPRKLDAITFPKWREESVKAYGNAIVPQVAYQIFKAIQTYEEMT